MPATQHFLGWDRPILELTAEFLVARAGEGMLDLSEQLVVVPTRNAGRRLREMLANLADERGQAMLAPRVVPTEFLLSLISTPQTGKLASPEESLLGWTRVLLDSDLGALRALFPVEPVAQDFAWALGTARSLMELRRSLGEAALEMEDVPRLAGEELEETERWLELADLEGRFKKLLARYHLADAATVRKRRVSAPDEPPGVREIVLAGTPDPVPIALQVLQQLSHRCPAHVLIHAPDSLAEGFDAWGRPKAAFWAERTIDVPESAMHVLPDSAAQAEAVAERVLAYEEPAQSVTVGIADEALAPAIERRLASGDVLAFNPQGEPLKTQGVTHFFRALGRLFEDRSYAAFIELLRCPDYLAYLAGKQMFWSTPEAFRSFDDLYQRHLPQTLSELRNVMRLGKSRVTLEMVTAINGAESLLADLRRKPLAKCLPELLHAVFSARGHLPGSEADRILRVTWERLSPLLDALDAPLAKPLKLSPAEQFQVIAQFLGNEQIYHDRPEDAVELLGWLELPWDDAPHLILTGFNDGMAPEAIVGDCYLPEQLRVILAKHSPIKTNDGRLARDAYLFETMLRARQRQGRVDIMFGKRSAKGDPLRPSRLLFRCPDEQLAGRAQHLFREVDPSESNLPWTPGFLLQPRENPPKIDSLGVTAFRDYLASPLHFYLRHIEKMRGIDGERLELDAAAFGTLCHQVLRRFGENPKIRDSRDPGAIRKFLHTELECVCAERFGSDLTLPVRIQMRSARQRLSAAAAVQARDREDGWRIQDVEVNLDTQLVIRGVAIRGKVDRIDSHEKTGEWRVLDYKTSDKAYDPYRGHLSRVTTSTNTDWLPEYARFELAGKEYRWKDLQLPLYRLALQEKAGVPIRCGYFNLPKAAGDTAISQFSSLQEAHDLAARNCAEGVIADVLAGRFWPVKTHGGHDEFAGLHLGIPEKTIDPASIQGCHDSRQQQPENLANRRQTDANARQEADCQDVDGEALAG